MRRRAPVSAGPVGTSATICALLVLLGWLMATGEVGAAELGSFQAGSGGWHMGTLGVGNLDNDSQLEIVIPYRDSAGQWYLDAFKASGTRLPGFPYAGG